jgi:hypothetical protein
MAGMLITPGFWSAQAFRFTLPFRETITIEPGGRTVRPNSLRNRRSAGLRRTSPKRAVHCREFPDRSKAFRNLVGCHSSRLNGPRSSRDRWMIRRSDFKGLGIERQPPAAAALERGRRRTRQDQISLGQKSAGEIADSRSAPNEENLFLLPDRFSIKR